MTTRVLLSITSAFLIAGLIAPMKGIAAQGFGTMPSTQDSTLLVARPAMSPMMRRAELSPLTGPALLPATPFMVQSAAPRSRTRGAKRGFLIGVIGGALIGLSITDDFMDEPMVNAALGASVFGIIGAGVGALVGAAPASPPGPGPSRSHAP